MKKLKVGYYVKVWKTDEIEIEDEIYEKLVKDEDEEIFEALETKFDEKENFDMVSETFYVESEDGNFSVGY